MAERSRCQRLDAEILDSVIDLLTRIAAAGEHVASSLAMPLVFIKALHNWDGPTAMKELGKRMHCDPSFVTVVADMLEQRGLARREPHPSDRRVKNLVLTDEGIDLKQRAEQELAASAPWSKSLTESEREQFAALLRKMLSADPIPATESARLLADMVSEVTGTR